MGSPGHSGLAGLRGKAGLRGEAGLDDQLGDAALDRVFRALADPARRSIVAQLAEGPASVSALGGPLSMSLAGVLQHVQVLEASGLVRTEKVGRTRTCRIEPRALRSAEAWISERRSLWERRLDRLGSFLESTAGDPPGGPAPRHAPGAKRRAANRQPAKEQP